MRSQSEKAMTLSERSPPGPNDNEVAVEKEMTLSERSPPGPNDNEVAVRGSDDIVRDIATRTQRQ